MAKPKVKSRPARWADAIAACQEVLGEIDTAYSNMENALSELKSVQEEYEEWKDNLPESLQSSALGEKLEAVCDLDIPDDPREVYYSDLDDLIGNADGMDLPQGFGRD